MSLLLQHLFMLSLVLCNSLTLAEKRTGKSLLNTFPFNSNNNNNNVDERVSRQRNREPNIEIDIGAVAAAGQQCIDKVVMVEETEYDNVIECKHSYKKRCYDTYKTDYKTQQEEKCEENFKKNCFIDYQKRATTEKVKFCFQSLVRNCNIPGPEECTIEHQTVCSTRYHEHDVEEDTANCSDEEEVKCEDITHGYTTEEKCSRWPVKRCSLKKQNVKKYTPETDCKKIPFQLCGPAQCPVEPGPEECQEKDETVVQDVPREVCNLEPQRECKHVTKLVPRLEATENCIDIPQEVCVRRRQKPRKVQKPIIKKWCYTPTKESGLGVGQTLRNVNQNQLQPTRRPQRIQEPQGCLPNRHHNYCTSRANNGRCDPECNIRACGYDNNECYVPPTTTTRRPPRRTTTRRPPRRTTTRRPTRRTTTVKYPVGCARGYSHRHCPSRSKNGKCDPECNTFACDYDGGDCVVVEEPELGYLPPVDESAKYRG